MDILVREFKEKREGVYIYIRVYKFGWLGDNIIISFKIEELGRRMIFVYVGVVDDE